MHILISVNVRGNVDVRRPNGGPIEFGFTVERCPGGYQLTVAVADPSAGKFRGQLSTRTGVVALVLTATVDQNGSLGPYQVTMDLAEIGRILTPTEIGEILADPLHGDHATLAATYELVLRLRKAHEPHDYHRAENMPTRSGPGLPYDELRYFTNHVLALHADEHDIPLVHPRHQLPNQGAHQSARPSIGIRGDQPYANIVGGFESPDARVNTERLIGGYLDQCRNRYPLGWADPARDAMGQIVETARVAFAATGGLPIPRFVEAAELLGPPPPWLGKALSIWLDRGAMGHFSMIHSLLFMARTNDPAWTALRRSVLDACRQKPQWIRRIMTDCENRGTVAAVDRWIEIAHEDDPGRVEAKGAPRLWKCMLVAE